MIFDRNSMWMGSDDSLLSVLELLQSQTNKHGSLREAEVAAAKMLSDESGEEEDYNPIEVSLVENVAIVPVQGPTVTYSSFFSQLFGVVSYEDIRERMDQVSREPGIDTVILELNTPGGSADGVPELSDYISNYTQNIHPVVTYNSGSMMSAGMWYGTAAGTVMAGQYAEMGSVGVITRTQEITKMLSDEGISVEVFRSSKYKALGGPYEKMTDLARAQIQERIDELHEDFVEALALNRGLRYSTVASDIATGKVFRAQKGVELGLVDAIMPLEETVARLITTNRY